MDVDSTDVVDGAPILLEEDIPTAANMGENMRVRSWSRFQATNRRRRKERADPAAALSQMT